ncbi:MAG TPA: ABC transporter permease subunit [Rugosimonospora sp.]|nr:ABC transporter permease subunit [Rugosimonospora sp.]
MTAPALRRPTLTGLITWVAAGCLVVLLLALFGSVLVESLATDWRGGWWPDGLTTGWLRQAWAEDGVRTALGATLESAVAVVAVALLVGVPAGYALARRAFPGRSAVMVFLLLPVMLPPLTYATQLTALLYRIGLGGSLLGVVIANLVPAVPLVVLVIVPFVNRISTEVEAAARVLGAGRLRLFASVLAPLLRPGILAAAVLAFVRVLGSFELTFFISDEHSQTLVVALYGAAANPNGAAPPLIAAMAVYYMAVALVFLAVGLRFVDPVSMAARRR